MGCMCDFGADAVTGQQNNLERQRKTLRNEGVRK
jgi:hypothetical protein